MKIVTIQDTFYLTEVGTVIVPEIPLSIADCLELNALTLVKLKFPYNNSIISPAIFQWSHFNPGGYKIICSFPHLTKDMIPIGAEIYLML